MSWTDGKSQLPIQDESPPPSANPFIRFLRFPLTLLVIGTVFWLIAQIIASSYFRGMIAPETRHIPMLQQGIPPYSGHWADLPYGIVVALLTILAYWLVKKIEGEPPYDFAGWKWSRELTGGLIIGAGLMALITGFVAIMGDYRIIGWGNAGILGFLSMIGLAISSGVGEEIMFRAFLFHYTEKMLGSWFALAFSAGLFGLLHIGNSNATWFSSAAIAIEAGIMLGALYMLTRRLWAVIGLHAAWNFTQGYIFGIPVSGLTTPALVKSEVSGSVWMTGGSFGLEASVPALIVATAAGLAILRLAIQRGQLKHPMWVKQKDRPEMLPPPPVNPVI